MPTEKTMKWNENLVAVIFIRGLNKTNKQIRDTIRMLGFKSKNNCLILEANEANMGMIKKVKDYVTWGKISKQMFDELISKRPDLSKHESKLLFSLHPPIGGFERGGIKRTFKQKGVLGDRGNEIDKLIKKMIALF